MKLNQQNKQYIDNLSYGQLLSRWRFSPIGDPWFQGETGKYWSERMAELQAQGADHVGTSKALGWTT